MIAYDSKVARIVIYVFNVIDYRGRVEMIYE